MYSGSSYVQTLDKVEHRNQLVNFQLKILMLEHNSINDHEVQSMVWLSNDWMVTIAYNCRR